MACCPACGIAVPQLLSLVTMVMVLPSLGLGQSSPRITVSLPQLLNHQALSEDGRRLFVGAVNRLYDLDASDLAMLQQVTTGPKEDSRDCPASTVIGGECNSPLESTPNHNKILVVDNIHSRLITCGSVYQGSCELRNLQNISNATAYPEVACAANNADSSTVAFLGPKGSDNNTLYVGAKYSGFNRYLEVPAVASRNTDGDKPFKLSSFDHFNNNKNSFISLDEDVVDDYLITYKSGFSSGGYSYFVTTQPEHEEEVTVNPEDNHISKIVQVCQEDLRCSYIEMPLRCTDGSMDYNVIQSAVLVTPGSGLARELGMSPQDPVVIGLFAKSISNITDLPSNNMAVCVYSLADIRQKFTDNLASCFANGPSQVLGRKFGTTSCTKRTGFDVTVNYCGEAGDCINSPLSGKLEMRATPILSLVNAAPPTAVAIHVVNDQHTVAFIGLANGHLKKVLLESRTTSRVITDLEVDEDSAIHRDLILSHSKTHLYAMTENKISRVPVSDCGAQITCDGCHGINDPYCGWCSLQNKCSLASECQDSLNALRWLTADQNCIELTGVEPQRANKHIPITVTIEISHLPPDERYQCVYSTPDTTIHRPASVTQPVDAITCETISDSDGLWISEDHIIVTLAIKSVSTNVTFLRETFTFYSCSEHLSCGQCGRSQFPCHWCLHDNQCKDQSETCMESGSIQAGNQDRCPQVDRTLTGSFLFPSGVARSYPIRGQNFPNDKAYRCKLYANETDTVVLATFIGTFVDSTHIECNDVVYAVGRGVKERPMVMKVFWKSGTNQVDSHITARAYNCRAIAGDCSSCVAQPDEDFECRWCPGVGCLFDGECRDTTSETCPFANIEMVEPDKFPRDGGSIITITGTNLGQYQSDIQSIHIVDLPCTLVAYEASRKILCRTAATSASKIGSVGVLYKYMNGTATVPFRPVEYKNPSITSVYPLQGPQSGGTKVTIIGHELDTGQNITVSLANVPCNIVKLEDDELLCHTSATSTLPNSREIRLMFDKATRNAPRNFDVRPDPVLENISPVTVFESGGRVITITGQDLNSVEKPELRLVQGEYTSSVMACRKLTTERLECPSPPIPLNGTETSTRRRRQTDNDMFTLKLTMDGVNCTNYISSCYKSANGELLNDLIQVFPDPIFHLFPDGMMKLEGKVLTLTGERLNLASTAQEVNVIIGVERCVVDSLNTDKLLCTPPDKQPKGATSGALPEVRVQVGNINMTLGKLEYAKGGVPTEVWIIVLAVGGGSLITIIIIVVAVYKRRSADVERQNKKLQIQLDNLESNVRNECKQAFAELQTEVSDFTSDLNVIGIPFWDYKMYTFRVLFPGLKDHPVLHQNDSVNKFGGIDQGLHQFSQLLNSKQFLLIFIRTLEQQKNFSIRDKSVVASLLMIVLQDKMEYATDILKSLLNELIDKSVEKKHPKLMLRRTESVVEKLLSNWLSLSMYTYLKKHAGKVLFMLFKAIKHQTEKGPIDVFTSEAKYSLSEDRLLREKVEPKTLTLHVYMNDMKEPATFKALDNDTVTQAKEKALDAIYMNSPFSPRPSVYDVELEWRSGRSGHLPLQDEDVTTRVDQGWKRVNTLLHYHVPDDASLVLVPSKSKNDLVQKKHGMIEIGNFGSTLAPIVTVEEGTKVWHLVKHDDNQNVQRTQKVISEIFLTRLLATKGTLQQYIDDLFMTILRADQGLPPAVKYLFDFLDTAARRHNLVDADVVHTWKSNSLPLRFWVNIVKNPEFIFDIHKSNIVDSCLSVIAQTFMDSCSTAEHRLGKDSPSNKLLFAKDIPRYRGWVSKFYKSVQDMAPISDQDMTRVMMEMSMTNFTDFNVSVALQDLYKYAMQYNFELLEALDDDPSAKRLHLANRFEQAQAAIEGTPLY